MNFVSDVNECEVVPVTQEMKNFMPASLVKISSRTNRLFDNKLSFKPPKDALQAVTSSVEDI